MKKITKIQIITMVLLILYAIWEFRVAIWAKTESGPIIRVDLIIIYPILIVLVCTSVYQFVKRKK